MNESGTETGEAGLRRLEGQVSALAERVRLLEVQGRAPAAEPTGRDGSEQEIARLGEEAARLRATIGALQAASADPGKKDAELSEVKSHAERLEVTLATARGVIAAQASRILYLEGEVDARFWRKVVTYLRRRRSSR